MTRVQITLQGQTPMLCHNERLANPDDPIVQEIAAITKKRTKTEEDRKEIARLEWLGGLYTDPGIQGPALPTRNLRKCLIQAAKVSRQGTQVQRALFFLEMHVPISYDGPRDVKKLYEVSAFQFNTSVGVNSNRTMRMRPRFDDWEVTASAELLDDLLDLDDLRRVVERAGLIEGLGDNRVNGFGRFNGQVTVV